MSDMPVAADGYAHARFVGEFFGGPIDSYSAVSSDNGVATAGVNPPDMLIVAPVSNGTASITVTAFGPGGMATQTFVARVGAGATQVNRPTVPQPSPPPPAPAPPPAREEPAADDSDVMVPTEEYPPRPPDVAEDSTTDAVPTAGTTTTTTTTTTAATTTTTRAGSGGSLTTEGPSPSVSVGVDKLQTLDISRHFSAAAAGFAVKYDATDPNRIVHVTVAGSVATIRGLRPGTVTITLVASITPVASTANPHITRSATITVN